MSTSVSSTSPAMSNATAAAILTNAAQANGVAASPGQTTGAAPSATGTAAADQAARGAEQAQQQKEESFNAPKLILPPDPTSREVLTGLTRAMADPTVNRSTAQQLYQLHEQIRTAEQTMIQAILDGVRS